MSAPMAMFVLMALGLVALALLPLRRALARAPVDGGAVVPAHRAVLQAHWAQLDQELQHGQIDAAEHARSRNELLTRLLEDEARAQPIRSRQPLALAHPQMPWPLMAGLPLLVLGLYLATGSPQAVNWLPEAHTMAMGGAERRDVEDMIDQMARRLRETAATQAPQEAAQAWAMVAQSYAGLGRFADAEQAFARASEHMPQQAQWLADRADMLAMANGQTTDGEPDRLIARALALDPDHPKALALAGSAAYNRQDMATALRHWRRARARAPEGSGFATELDRSIAAAQAGARGPLAPSAGISGTVSLSPQWGSSVAPTDSVFVLVRAIDGPRAPLAVSRHTVAELPLRFALDDSHAMTPEHRLSLYERVEVVVRISRAGEAMARPGDLYAQSIAVGPRSQGLNLVIDREVP